MSYTLFKFGTTPLPGNNSETDIGTGQAAESIIDLPGGGIYDAMGWTNKGLQKSGPITKKLLAYTDETGEITDEILSNAVRNLRALIGTRDKLYRRWADGRIEWCWARLTKISGQRGPGLGSVLTPINLQFTRISPLWYGRYRSDWSFDSSDFWGYDFYLDSGLYFDEELISIALVPDDTVYLDVPNEGNAPILNSAFLVYPDIGSGETNLDQVTGGSNPTFDFSFASLIDYGNALHVDSGRMAVTFGGNPAYGDLVFGGAHADNLFMTIPPGGTQIAITDSGGTLTVTAYIYYYEAWQ